MEFLILREFSLEGFHCAGRVFPITGICEVIIASIDRIVNSNVGRIDAEKGCTDILEHFHSMFHVISADVLRVICDLFGLDGFGKVLELDDHGELLGW
jgi:hypothetical protein